MTTLSLPSFFPRRCNSSTLNEYEYFGGLPSYGRLAQYAERLGVPVCWFFEQANHPAATP